MVCDECGDTVDQPYYIEMHISIPTDLRCTYIHALLSYEYIHHIRCGLEPMVHVFAQLSVKPCLVETVLLMVWLLSIAAIEEARVAG